MDMLYLAVSPGREGHVLNEDLLRRQPNRLAELLPSANNLAHALWVVDSDIAANDGALFLNVDSMKQRGVFYCASKT
jgi:predicted ABC-type ATPase